MTGLFVDDRATALPARYVTVTTTLRSSGSTTPEHPAPTPQFVIRTVREYPGKPVIVFVA